MATTEQIDILSESDSVLLNELKLDIVHRITEIDDLETIKDVFLHLREHAPKEPYVLSPEDKAALERGRKDFAEGRWITQDQLKEKIAQWRKEKEK